MQSCCFVTFGDGVGVGFSNSWAKAVEFEMVNANITEKIAKGYLMFMFITSIWFDVSDCQATLLFLISEIDWRTSSPTKNPSPYQVNRWEVKRFCNMNNVPAKRHEMIDACSKYLPRLKRIKVINANKKSMSCGFIYF